MHLHVHDKSQHLQRSLCACNFAWLLLTCILQEPGPIWMQVFFAPPPGMFVWNLGGPCVIVGHCLLAPALLVDQAWPWQDQACIGILHDYSSLQKLLTNWEADLCITSKHPLHLSESLCESTLGQHRENYIKNGIQLEHVFQAQQIDQAETSTTSVDDSTAYRIGNVYRQTKIAEEDCPSVIARMNTCPSAWMSKEI